MSNAVTGTRCAPIKQQLNHLSLYCNQSGPHAGICSDLVYLILLAAVHGLRIGWGPQPELRIAKVAVSVNIVQTFPDDLLLRQETLVCNQVRKQQERKEEALTFPCQLTVV
ncbi:hypothetical protein EYF80_002229 [Liparis tanakae]|uniref:Uncharacterized protein n=1 Tax=Liparis tanakae TaxID=230148 RepID=A0A4Z2JE46_9TELE|nr:hypothetical protein EYF80_002229 [Liparis tanakae]